MPAPPFPLSMLENSQMQTCFRSKCFVNIAQGWGGAKCKKKQISNPFDQGCRSICFNLQWATKVVETLLGKDGFRYLSICSILFASSVNSLILRSPNSMLCRHSDLCSRRNRKINIVLGKGRKCGQDAQKSNFTTKCLHTFVAHCSLVDYTHFDLYVNRRISVNIAKRWLTSVKVW